MAKSDSFDILREIFQRSKQQNFYHELVFFTITDIASYTLLPTLSKWEVLQFGNHWPRSMNRTVWHGGRVVKVLAPICV